MINPFAALFERRSINSSHDLLMHLLRGHQTTAGQTVNETTAMNVAAVMTGVSIRSRLLASLPVDVIERVDARTRRPAEGHPVRRVLLQPNRFSLRQTKSEFVGMLEAHRILRGNGYAWVNRVSVPARDGVSRLQVEELLPIHPDKLEVDDSPDEFGPNTYKLHRTKGDAIQIPSLEVLHLKSLSTNGRTGRPFISDLREVIGGALATQEHANSLWSRDATPSVVLKHPKTLSEKAQSGLEQKWEATYGRSKDKRRVAVLEEGMDLEQLSLKPDEGQFLETQQDIRAQIAAALMVPAFMMGLAEKATSWGSGIEQQQIGLLVFTLSPDAGVWEERLNMDLIAVPDKYQVKFNVFAMLRGDMATQGQFFRTMREIGAFSANDVRALLDLNPVEGGDEYLRPSNLTPLGVEPSKAGAGASA